MAVRGLGGAATKFLSRGFEISNVQIDGASVDAFSQQLFDPNLAMYDSVQVVRGANGLFSGNGEPGGAINLVRKRPTAQKQILGSVGVGSWSRKQAELDVAGPLNEAGSLRGRAVLAHSDKNFFYRGADSQNSLLYGILEADVTSSTRVSLGASYDKLKATPWREGLPRAANGDDLKLSRKTALMAGWSHYDKSAKEILRSSTSNWRGTGSSRLKSIIRRWTAMHGWPASAEPLTLQQVLAPTGPAFPTTFVRRKKPGCACQRPVLAVRPQAPLAARRGLEQGP
jgi:outer membrane receptor for ferric coprogen and ferric-rhodotorulic acid